MSFSLVQTKSAGTSSGNSASPGAFSGNTTTGNMLLFVITMQSTTTPVTSVTDGTNNFTRLSTTADASSYTTEVWYCPNIVGKTTPTVTAQLAGIGAEWSVMAREYSSTIPLSLDKQAVTAVTAQNPSSGNTATTSYANELVIGVFGGTGTQTKSAGSGYGNYAAAPTSSGEPFTNMEDKQVSSTGAQAATFTTSATGNGVVGVYTFFEQPLNTIDTLETFQEILTQDYTYNGAGTTTYGEILFTDSTRVYTHKFLWDPSRWDGVSAIYFESQLEVSGGSGTVFVKLHNVTDNTDITGSEISATTNLSTGATRSADISANMPTTPKTIAVYVKNSTSSLTSQINSARLVIKQSGATKFAQAFEIDQADFINGTTTPWVDPYAYTWKYEATKYDGVVRIGFDVNGAAVGSGNTGTVDLWDLTSSTAITTLNFTTSQSYQWVNDVKPLLTDGHEYSVRLTSTIATSSSMSIGGARIIIVQSMATKMQFMVTGIIAGLVAGTNNDGAYLDPTFFDSRDYKEMFAEITYTANSTSGAGRVYAKDASGTEWTNSSITSTAGDINGHRVRNATAMTFPTSQAWYRPYNDTTAVDGIAGNVWRAVVNLRTPQTFSDTHTTDSYLSTGNILSTDFIGITFSQPAQTRTHTTDANKRKANTLAHTTDANKKKTNTLSHTTDSNKKKSIATTHTTDSLLRKQFTKTHTTDSNKKKTTTLSHTTDANKKLATLKTHTTDANKKKSLTVSHTTDSNKKKSLSVSHTTDANKKKSGVTKTHTTDALKRKQFTLSHTTDSLLRKQFTKSHTTDSNKRKATLVSHTTDANKKKTTTVSHATDANKKTSGILKAHTTDSFLRKQFTKTHTTDSFLRKQFTKSHTTDANKRLATLKTHTTDANKKKSLTVSHSTDSNKKKTSTLSHNTDSFLRKQFTKTHTTDSFLRKQQTRSHTTDSNKRLATLKSHTTDANKRLATLKTHTTDSLKRKQFTLSHTTDSFLRKQFTKTHTTDALKRTANLRAHPTDANKRKATLVIHTTDSNKRKALTVSHTTDALKRTQNTRTHTTDSFLRKQFTKTHSTDSLIRKASLLIHSTDSNKRKATLVSHTTDANKKTSGVLKTHTTDSLLRKQFTKSHTTDANKKKTVTTSHTTDSSIIAGRVQTHTTDSNKKKSTLVSHTTDSNKKTAGVLKTHTTDSLLRERYPKNELYNGDFELGTGTTNANFSVPGWVLTTPAAATLVTVDTTQPHGGSQAIKMLVDSTNSNNGIKTALASPMSVRPNDNYQLTLWVKSDTAGQMQIQLRDGSNTGNYLQSDGVTWNSTATYFSINTTTSYTQFVLNFVTDGTGVLTIADFKRSGNSSQASRTFYVDDVQITSVTWHSTDANKKKSNTLSHTTDSNKRKAATVSHTTDANKRKTTLVSHTTDSNKRKSFSVSHTTSANKKKSTTLSHTTDSLLRKQFTKSHSTDSLIRKQFTRSHTTDSNKRRATLLFHTTDSLKRKQFVLSHTTDTNKRKLFTLSHTTDSLLRRHITVSHTTDANKRRATLVSHTTDSNIERIGLQHHTTDSNKRKATLVSHLTDALLRRAISTVHTTDSNKKHGQSLSHSTDARMSDAKVKIHSTDASKFASRGNKHVLINGIWTICPVLTLQSGTWQFTPLLIFNGSTWDYVLD